MPSTWKERERRAWARALGLAAVAGLRCTLGPALAVPAGRRSAGLRRLGYACALGELVGDKVPSIPARTRGIGLAARAVSGALVASRRGPGRTRRAGGLVLGAATAVAAAFLGQRVRRSLTRLLGGGALANAFAGVIEDAAAIALARKVAG
jgi:hypothetical protein